MKHFKLITIFFLLAAIKILAQKPNNISIIGKVREKESNEAIIQATVQLMDEKGMFINGTITNQKGDFDFTAKNYGKYTLKVSFVGYKTITNAITISDKATKYNAGTIYLKDEAVELKGTTITAEIPQVVVKEDTLIYNSDAYRLPESSALEELVKKLPGAEVDDDGNITINGKKIKKIMVEGKEFFSSDTKVAMKNIPVEMVDKIKSYDRKSDLARISGIDDGEEEAILDLTVKKGMKQGWFGNVNASTGNKNRYSDKFSINRFTDNKQITAIGSINNTGDKGFPGGGGRFRSGGGNRGLTASKTGGINFAIDNKKHEFGGNIRYAYNDNDTKSLSSRENFYSSNSSFSNSLSSNRNRSKAANADFRLEWRPDSMTNIILRPSGKISKSNGAGSSQSATFNKNPYLYVTNPLEEVSSMPDSVKINSSINDSRNLGNDNSISTDIQFNRRLNKEGKNITIRGSIGYNDSDKEQSSIANTTYYQLMSASGSDSINYRNRYIISPNKNWNYSAQLAYSEPIAKATFLQFSYKFSYRNQKNSRSTYSLNDKSLGIFDIPDNYIECFDASLSQSAENKYYNHNISLMLRVIRNKYNFSAGISLQPQTSKTIYTKGGINIDTVRNVINFTPTLNFRYRASKVRQMRITYRGKSSQPNITNLLPITDNSNPLNIREGNPGLKPSFSNDFDLNYNDYKDARQQSIQVNISFNNTINSISNCVTYDAKTGAKTTRPENINGNWSASGNFNFNTGLKDKRFHINTNTRARYTNAVGFYYNSKEKETLKNTTCTSHYGEHLSGNFRNDWFEFSANGSISYTHSRNKFQENSNLDTYQFSYGASSNLSLPYNIYFSTDISNNCRRGYSDASMNKDELIWNVQISYRFLRKKAATLSLQIYDILGNQSNISRSITAYSRSDTQYNSINSYFLVNFLYRINIFGNKEARQHIHRMNKERNIDNNMRSKAPRERRHYM